MEGLVGEKIIIPVTECIPGMTLMQSIIDEQTGVIIIGKGQVLTEESIERLKNFSRAQLWVALGEESSIWKLDPHARTEYKNYAKKLKFVIEHIKDGSIDIKEIEELASDMMTKFENEYDLLACVNLTRQLDKDSFYHSINVAFLALTIGRWEGYSKEKLKNLVLAALLHDVGKLSLRSELQSKEEEKMNFLEKLEFTRHPIYSYDKLVSYQEVNVEVLKGILSHHERCDGSGYPLSLRENKINDFAKIIGIADTYDYLKRQNHIFEVVRYLGNIMIRKFDVNVLLQFCYNLANYYVGCFVLLNTGEVGEVVCVQYQALGRPIIKLRGEYVNLNEKTYLEIVKVL